MVMPNGNTAAAVSSGAANAQISPLPTDYQGQQNAVFAAGTSSMKDATGDTFALTFSPN